MIKILQVIPETWTGTDGRTRTDFVGLGDDGLMYRWHRVTGKWVLYIQTN